MKADHRWPRDTIDGLLRRILWPQRVRGHSSETGRRWGRSRSCSTSVQLFLIFLLQFIHFTANKSFSVHLFVFGALSSPRLMGIRSSVQLNKTISRGVENGLLRFPFNHTDSFSCSCNKWRETASPCVNLPHGFRGKVD